MKQIKIYKLRSVNESDPPGSINNPYTWAKFMEKLYVTFDWIGGYVEGRGYIPQNVSVAGSSIMIIDGSCGDSSYYPYWFFSTVNETLHHTYTNPDGSQVVLTDISVKASIDVYRMTIKVNITKKDNCYINNYYVYLNVEDCPHESSKKLENQSIDNNKFSNELSLNLPTDSMPHISLDFDCYYELNGNPGSDKKSVKIYPQD